MQSGYTTFDIRSLVKNYTVVPGLVLATIGGYVAFTGAFNIFWNKWLYWVLFGSIQRSWLATLGGSGSLILPCIIYLIVMIAVLRYYKLRFGQVKPRPAEKKRLTIELVAAFVAYFFIGQTLDMRLHLAVSTTMLIVALFLLVHWWMFARVQVHYLLLAALAVVLSFVPLFSSAVYSWLYVSDISLDWYRFSVTVCTGLLLLCAGLLDHWRMARLFARVRSHVEAHSSDVPALTDVQPGMEEL